MKTTKFFQGAVIALASIGLMLPAPQVMAATSAKTNVQSVDVSTFDIGLQKNGAFMGRVVDHTGTPAKNAEVVVRQGSKEVARTTTDAEGRFAVNGLRGGAYEISSGKTVGSYRVWQSDVAPPASKEQALLVLGENGTRGQFGAVGGGTILIAAAVIASLIISAITLDRVNDIDDRIPNSP